MSDRKFFDEGELTPEDEEAVIALLVFAFHHRDGTASTEVRFARTIVAPYMLNLDHPRLGGCIYENEYADAHRKYIEY